MKGGRIRIGWCPALFLLLVTALLIYIVSGKPLPIETWHSVKLTEEFTADRLEKDIRSFEDYLQLEDRLFRQLDEEIYAGAPTGPAQLLNRFSPGSHSDPRHREPNWNRSFVLNPDGERGGVLLLHGMSDSPYSLRALGEHLASLDYRVVGLRIPGHGTAPSGLKYLHWRDAAAAVTLAVKHLAASNPSGPLHIIGYSTGAPLALDYSIEAKRDPAVSMPDSLVLISPAIGINRAAGLARFKNALAVLPGLGGWAWLDVMDEFDPYKYNSFATNAAAQVFAVTTDVDRRMAELAAEPGSAAVFPPILVLQSTVDATVTTSAVVDRLLKHLPAGRNELVLFDINREAAVESTILVSDPGPLTQRLMNDDLLPFTVRFVSNESQNSIDLVARYKPARSREVASIETLAMVWPRGVVSLSHVAMPFPPDDPLYGQVDPGHEDLVFLGNLAIRGERGLLKLPADWLLRLRYNPFYDFMESRIVDWLDEAGEDSGETQRH
jgi:alpha-beta hydrolase superfamily lysophospholipase